MSNWCCNTRLGERFAGLAGEYIRLRRALPILGIERERPRRAQMHVGDAWIMINSASEHERSQATSELARANMLRGRDAMLD
jgi:hypothetical protein